MRTFYRIIVIVVGVIVSLQAQTEWKMEQTQNNQITIKYRIDHHINEQGKEDQILDYIVTTTTDKSIEAFAKVLKDAKWHKEFLDSVKKSALVKEISPNEWIVYYYFNIQWPLPDADCVVTMTSDYDVATKTLTIKGHATPSAYPKSEVDRISYYDVIYTIKALNDNKTEVSMALQMTPATQAPDWMTKSWFPDGPSKVLSRLVSLADEKKAVQ